MDMTEKVLKKKYNIKDYLKFIIPSLLGILLLVFPFNYEGEATILVAALAKITKNTFSHLIPITVVFLVGITAIISLIYKIFKPKVIEDNKYFKSLFDVGSIWLLIRWIGFVFSIMIYFKKGPEFIISGNTGGLILNDLILTLFTIFLFAGFLISVLTDFGLLEYIGVLLTPVMRPLFKLPGRSSVNAIASWVGDGTIGVAMANSQYERGYYTKKEAAIIATTFSAVSITFCLVVLGQVNLQDKFGIFYLVVTLTGIITAMIMPRIYPLSKKPNTYINDNTKDRGEEIPENFTSHQWALHLAIEKAEENFDFKRFIKEGAKTVLDMWLGVLPAIITFGTIGLILAEYTKVFQYMGLPFLPIIKLLNIPYAVEMSETIMVGFADMFLPTVLAVSIPSDMTRFIIAAVSVTQLIYISEAGAVILGSSIDVNLFDLFIIFIERTLITLPIITLFAKLIF